MSDNSLTAARVNGPRTEPARRRITLVLLALVLLGTAGFILSARQYALQTTAVADNGDHVSIIAAPGQAVTFGIRIPALDGHWASDQTGVTLTLDGHQPIQVIDKKEQDWDGLIVSDHEVESGPSTIQGTVTLPADLSPGSTVSGHLDGFVQYPEGSDGTFQDQEMKVAIPVRVQVVGAPSFILSSGLFALVASLVVLVGAGVVLGVRRLRRLARPTPKQLLTTFGMALVVGLFIGLGCVMLPMIGTAAIPSVIIALTIAVPSFLTLLVMVGLLGPSGQRRTANSE